MIAHRLFIVEHLFAFRGKKIYINRVATMISVEIVRCRIPDLLFRLGKTQAWLAAQTGYSRSRVSDYVTMRETMSLRTAATVATVLRCTINELYQWNVTGLGRE